jgi:putative ABC transport system ATP-binding protein
VSIARALANQPPVVLADEPTAPLDSDRALTVVRILNDMARRYQTAIIVVTHDEKIIPTFRRIYRIRDGRTYEEAGEGRDPGAAGAEPVRAAAGAEPARAAAGA